MKKYFSQFGRVLNLRLSRNKKTGASKHYAFVEFASAEVADIVARTMNNYLMFGHILRVALIPKEQVNANLFKGANARFKVDPRNKKAGLAMSRGAERPVWEKRVEKENKRRTARAKELKESMDYEFTNAGAKSVDTVTANKALEPAPNSAEQQLLTEAAADSNTKARKGKKNASAAAVAKAAPAAPVVEETVVTQTVVEEVPASTEAPAKRATRKRTSTSTTEVVAEKPVVAEKDKVKAKKAKKAKA
jgi:nucleolar protein 15